VTEEDIPEPTVITTIRLRREQHDRLREIAVHEDRSMGSVVRRLIDERIAADEERQPQS
jgi:predicted DNA-binding protein